MKKWIALTLCLLSTQTSFALLSPLNQSIEEMRSILHSSELQEYFPQAETLIEIKKIDSGYLLTTQTLQMRAELAYIPTQQPGRQKFRVIFHPPTPKNSQSR